MVFTINDIKKRVLPIVVKYGITTFSLFGSYARGEADENSDLDFVMDDGDLKGLQYVSLILDLEEEFNCHVDVVSRAGSNKKFLIAIKNDEVLYMNEKDKRTVETIIDYCNRLEQHLKSCDYDKIFTCQIFYIKMPALL